MDKLNASYNAKEKYPDNLKAYIGHQDQLVQYKERLQDHRERLFCDPEDAIVYLLQLDKGQVGECSGRRR